jgi:hypothetical protein
MVSPPDWANAAMDTVKKHIAINLHINFFIGFS